MTATLKSLNSSYVNTLRRRRFGFFETLLEGMTKPVRVLDCGGTADFWQTNTSAQALRSKFDVTIINLVEPKEIPCQMKWYQEPAQGKEFHELISQVKWLIGDVRGGAGMGRHS